MPKIKLIDSIDVKNTLGECVVWDDRRQKLLWTDIQESRLYSYDHVTKELTSFNCPERLASFGLTENDEWLICAFESGFALYQPESATVDWIARPEKSLISTRFNDGRVDRQGRFWAGTMVEQPSESETGSLYCLSGREIRKVLGGIKIPNSICWSLDSNYFYFADSPLHCIQTYPFNWLNGTIGKPSLLTCTTPPYEPDGSAVDAEDNIWNALWGGGKVLRYNNTGKVTDEVDLPVSQPTCLAFGGADMSTLFVTTARVGLSPEQLKTEPLAGSLLLFQTPYNGVEESRFSI